MHSSDYAEMRCASHYLYWGLFFLDCKFSYQVHCFN